MTHRHFRDDPRQDVGVVECGLYHTQFFMEILVISKYKNYFLLELCPKPGTLKILL